MSEVRHILKWTLQKFVVSKRRGHSSGVWRKCSSEVRRAFEEAVTNDVSLCCELCCQGCDNTNSGSLESGLSIQVFEEWSPEKITIRGLHLVFD